MINDILDFSKIEAGKLDLEAIDFNLRDTVWNDDAEDLTLRADEKGLELACEIPRHVPTFLTGDSTRLRQVLVNLVGNAIKFTEEGEIVVSVEDVKSATTEVELHFTVATPASAFRPKSGN